MRERMDLIRDHQRVWEHDIQVKADFSGIQIPEPRNGFEQILVIPRFDINELWEACKRKFNAYCTRGDDLRSLIVSEDRSLQGGYAFLHRGDQCADDQLKVSANDIVRQGLTTMDLGERLAFEWIYYVSTGEHLDPRTITLTSTRAKDGRYAWVYWLGGRLWVFWCDPGYLGPGLRARQVVVS